MNFAIQSTFEKSKQIHWTIAFSIISFVLLFHQTGIGLNLAIFDIFILLFWVSTEPGRFKEPMLILTSVATLATAICTAWYGTPDTVIWSVVCLAWLSQQMLYPENSILFFETKAFLNLFLGPLTALINTFDTERDKLNSQRLSRALLVVVLPVVFAFVFASLYQNFNPYFEKGFTDFLALIDLNIILTILLGAVVSLCIFKNFIPDKLSFLDQMLGNRFNTHEPLAVNPHSALEKQAGLALFGILNLVLTAFLISDVAFVNQLSHGIGENYSRYVHQGVGMLIFSILIATSFILYFFRGREFSHMPNSHWLKRLALLWVALNICILITTGFKNGFYVLSYGLTLKRVGVFVYLSLALSGLVFAFIKVFLGRTNAFLFRKLYWSFFLILTVNMCFDWSSITARFNLHENIKDHRPLDWGYLLTLDERTLPILLEKKKHLNLPKDEMEQLELQLEIELRHLKGYHPDWREMSLAESHAKSKIVNQ